MIETHVTFNGEEEKALKLMREEPQAIVDSLTRSMMSSALDGKGDDEDDDEEDEDGDDD